MDQAAREATDHVSDAVGDVVKRVHEAVDQVEKLAYRTNESSANIEFNLGSVAVWMTATMFAVVVAVVLVGALWVSREFSRIDSVFNDLNDKDSVHDAYINQLRSERQKETEA